MLTIDVAILADRRAVVRGRTNLPEGEVLIVSVKRLNANGEAQSSPMVNGGMFESEPLGPAAGLVEGNYVASVTLPYSKLSGYAPRLLNRAKATIRTSSLGVTVTATHAFSVGNTQQINAADRRDDDARKQAAVIRTEMVRLIESGRNMRHLRGDRSDLEMSRACGELMRKLQAQVRDLAARADELPQQHARLLNASFGALELCVSCSAGLAPKSCDAADELLREVR